MSSRSGGVDVALCVAAVVLVALVPFLGALGGGAFGFPGASVWALVVAPVVLVLLARRNGTDDGGDTGA